MPLPTDFTQRPHMLHTFWIQQEIQRGAVDAAKGPMDALIWLVPEIHYWLLPARECVHAWCHHQHSS